MTQSESVGVVSRYRTTVYLLIAWLLVCLPLGWGVYETFTKSLLLFR